MKRLTLKLQPGLTNVLGTPMTLNETQSGNVISYNIETGEALVEVADTSNQVQDSLNGNIHSGLNQLNS